MSTNKHFYTTNFVKAYTITIIIGCIVLITLAAPFLLMVLFPTSGLTQMFFSFPYFFIMISGALFLLYFWIVGIYVYWLKLDGYVIEVISKRTISGYLGSKRHLEMPTESVKDFSFFNRHHTFNTTLMIKVRMSAKKIIAKRFNLSFLTKKEREQIRIALERIILENKKNGES